MWYGGGVVVSDMVWYSGGVVCGGGDGMYR